MKSAGGILSMIGPLLTSIAPALGPAAPFAYAGGVGSTLAGGGMQLAQGSGSPKPLIPPPTSTLSATPNVAGGAPETPASGLSSFTLPSNVPAAGPSTGQPYAIASMGNNIAQNLFSEQNPFYAYA